LNGLVGLQTKNLTCTGQQLIPDLRRGVYPETMCFLDISKTL